MTPSFQTITPKKLIGQHVRMSLADNQTAALWRNFMGRRKEIQNNSSQDLISMAIYDNSYFRAFNPGAFFEKWAAVEVGDFAQVPETMDTYEIPAGLYAVFTHKGTWSEAVKAMQYIFGTWLPASEYELDDRPHFEIMGEKYNRDDPDSEEDFWIPVKKK